MNMKEIIDAILKSIEENNEMAKAILNSTNATSDYKEYAQSCIDINESTAEIAKDIPVDSLDALEGQPEMIKAVKSAIDLVVEALPLIRKNYYCLIQLKKELSIE